MSAQATTIWISGPVLRAQTEGAFLLREAVTVGEQRLLGEVIRVARGTYTFDQQLSQCTVGNTAVVCIVNKDLIIRGGLLDVRLVRPESRRPT